MPLPPTIELRISISTAACLKIEGSLPSWVNQEILYRNSEPGYAIRCYTTPPRRRTEIYENKLCAKYFVPSTINIGTRIP